MDSAIPPQPATDQTTFADAFVRQFLLRRRSPRHGSVLLHGLPTGLTAENPFQDTHDLLVVMSSRGFSDCDFVHSPS